MRCILLILIATIAWASDPPAQPLPPEAARIVAERDAAVARAKAAYDAAVAKATADGTKKLEAAVVKITKSGNLKGALAAQAVLDGWKGEAEAAGRDLLGEKRWREVWIEAISDGVTIGRIQKGQTVEIQYAEGAWSFGGSMADKTLSPDSASAGAALRLGLFNVNGNMPIASIPGGTADKPFEIAITDNGTYCLRIIDSGRADNFGKVKYRYIIK